MTSPTRFSGGGGITTASVTKTLAEFGMLDPTEWHTYFQDFHTYTAADFTNTETGTGTRALAVAEPFGALLVTNAAADNDLNQFQLTATTFSLTAGKKAFFKARFKVSDATQSDFLIGLAILDTSLQGSVSGAGVTDGVFFNKDDGDALLDFQVQKNATTGQTRAVGVATVVSDTYLVVSWYYDGVDQVKYYVNEVQQGSLNGSSTYLPDAPISISFAIQNGEAVAKTMTVDYLFASIER